MPDTYPHHTPYDGPLPIDVQAYLDGHPDRQIRVRSAHPADKASDRQFVAFVYSEHGWPLASHRTSGPTEEATLQRLHERGPLYHVQPRHMDDHSRWC